MSTTANMGLTIPTPSVTTGPTWAQNINDSLGLVDLHDHSSAKGVRITQSGINLTGDLPLNSNRLTSVLELRLVTGTASALGISTDGTDLYFKDGGSTSIKLTANGRVGPCLAGDYGSTGNTAQLKYTNSTTLYELFSDAGVTYADLKAKGLTLTGAAVLGTTLNVTGLLTCGAITASGALALNGTTTILTPVISGNLTFNSGINVVLNTGTGTKIGTAANQKLGFYGATAIVQPAVGGSIGDAGFTNGGGAAVLRGFSSTGSSGATAYTFNEIVLALKNLGLIPV